MIIVSVVPDCGRHPIRFACFLRRPLPHAVAVIISDDESTEDFPCYELKIRCGKAYMDGVSDFHGLHGGSDGERGRIPLDENGNPFCVHCEDCPLSNLTAKELLFPLVVDELTPYKAAIDPHRDH
jgi:hypothetical protein